MGGSEDVGSNCPICEDPMSGSLSGGTAKALIETICSYVIFVSKVAIGQQHSGDSRLCSCEAAVDPRVCWQLCYWAATDVWHATLPSIHLVGPTLSFASTQLIGIMTHGNTAVRLHSIQHPCSHPQNTRPARPNIDRNRKLHQ